MPDIFDEVEQDLRAERTKRFLMRYAGVLIGLIVLVIAGAGGWQVWKNHQQMERMRTSDAYQAAQLLADNPSPDRPAAIAALAKLAGEGNPGYRTLAELREAALKADGGDLTGASALWDQVAGNSDTPPLLRDLASLLWAMHHIDTPQSGEVAARLQPLLAADNPWHALAGEMQAVLDIKQGETDAARSALKQLAQDITAPAGVRGRANGLLQQLGG